MRVSTKLLVLFMFRVCALYPGRSRLSIYIYNCGRHGRSYTSLLYIQVIEVHTCQPCTLSELLGLLLRNIKHVNPKKRQAPISNLQDETEAFSFCGSGFGSLWGVGTFFCRASCFFAQHSLISSEREQGATRSKEVRK